jgi:hypothetical protein
VAVEQPGGHGLELGQEGGGVHRTSLPTGR